MKTRYFFLSCLVTFMGIAASTVYAQPPQDTYVEYFDAEGNVVGYYYSSCTGSLTHAGTTTSIRTTEHTSCEENPSPPDYPILD